MAKYTPGCLFMIAGFFIAFGISFMVTLFTQEPSMIDAMIVTFLSLLVFGGTTFFFALIGYWDQEDYVNKRIKNAQTKKYGIGVHEYWSKDND